MDQEKEDKIEIKEVIPDNLKEYTYSNIFKVGYTERDFLIDFGQIEVDKKGNLTKSDNKYIVNVVGRVALPISIIKALIGKLLKSGIDYEKEYDVDLGFFTKEENKKDSEE